MPRQKHREPVPIISMAVCPTHQPAGKRIAAVRIEKDMDVKDAERMAKIMTCPNCWDLSEDKLLKVCDLMGFDTETRMIMAREIAHNRFLRDRRN